MKLLVDSSIWIDFFRDKNFRLAELERAIRENRAMICPVVWVELWSGVRSKSEESTLWNMRDCCGWLEMDEKVWGVCAQLRLAARKKGINCPLADVLVVSCAKRHGAELLHNDKHLSALLKIGL